MFVLKVPASVLPASIAARIFLGLTEQLPVIIVFTEGAVDEVLLGEAHWSRIVLDGYVSFKSCVSCKSIA